MSHSPDDFVHSCIKLAVSMADKAWRYYRGHGSGTANTREEFISAAYIGLVRASRLFNPSLGFKFSTYAYHAIRRELYDTMKDMKHPGFSGCSHKKDDEIPGISSFPEFFDAHANEDDRVERNEQIAFAHELIDRLQSDDRKLMRARYIEGLTLEECAKRFGRTKERMRQRVVAAIDRIKQSCPNRSIA